MSYMVIEVEFMAGTDIRRAVTEAKDKAALFDVAYITFNFNGVRFSIGRNADIDAAVKAFHEDSKCVVQP